MFSKQRLSASQVAFDPSGNLYVAQNKWGFKWSPNIGNAVVVLAAGETVILLTPPLHPYC